MFNKNVLLVFAAGAKFLTNWLALLNEPATVLPSECFSAADNRYVPVVADAADTRLDALRL